MLLFIFKYHYHISDLPRQPSIIIVIEFRLRRNGGVDTGSRKMFLTIYKAIYQIAKLKKGRGMTCEMQPICCLPPVTQGSYDDHV